MNWLDGYALIWHWHGMGLNLDEPKLNFLFAKIPLAWRWKGKGKTLAEWQPREAGESTIMVLEWYLQTSLNQICVLVINLASRLP